MNLTPEPEPEPEPDALNSESESVVESQPVRVRATRLPRYTSISALVAL